MQDAEAPDPEPSSTEENCLPENGSRKDQEQNSVEAEREAEADGATCTICGAAKASALLDLRSNHVMQRRLSRDWKIHADVIRSTLKAICVECVCKLNMHSEVTRSLMQRMQRLQRSGGETTTVTTTTTSPSQHSPPIADAEVSTTLIEGQEEAAEAGASSYTPRSSCSVLEVYLAQQPYSPTAKEAEEKQADGWKWRTRLECQECGRAYFRRDYYAQHLRRCSKLRRAQPRPPRAKCRVLNEASCDEEAPSRVTRSSRIYYCRHCDDEFDSMIGKRQHERLKHKQRFPCDLCEAQLDTKYEWELHHTICQAKQEALIILQEQESGLAAESRTHSMRSRSRACSEAWDKYDVDDRDAENDENDSYEEEPDEGEDDQEEGDDDQEDAMYTRRMNFTGDWIVNHSRSNSNSAANLSHLYDEYGLGETHMTTDKEYDLYLLDLLKKQVRLKAFSCFTPSCGYQTDTLVALMKHDYMEHWKMSWFYCHKCGDVFTSKVFLDYHLHLQNRGLYICHKCRDEFELQHQLDRHFQLHRKGINYHCNFCRLEFLSEAKLLAHCKLRGHSPNDEPLISIDRSLSIVNCHASQSPDSPRISKSYEEREFYIPRIKVPSMQPMHLPQHKPFRFAIGICDFEEKNPNCVGCH
ncbi:gastrula zinc finger protein xFG20-1 [Drosophila ficusphila]|uniref:gastrula zinc finger protein xFG20-1 n=1 Tax=Drosophila ficusphila TaxID=30025 RepID=UPI0007E71612|nr:gastrula zinc finger protein xFG20-1 [Drosophila ficusphila]